MGALYMGLAELHWEWNNLEKAREEGLLGLDHVRRWGLPTALVVGHVVWARIARASGHMSEALEAIGEAEGYARNYHVSPEVRMVLNEFRVRLWLATGDKEAAGRWAEGRAHPEFRGLALIEELENMALARVLIAQGKIAEANPLLSRLEEGAKAGKRGCRLILILVLRAWALYSQGMLPQAAAVLVEALRLGRPEACVRMFVEEGSWMVDLLNYALEKQEIPGPDLQEYARLLLAACDTRGFASPSKVRPCPLVEPLTPRELEVLGLMTQGKTNREIAETLVVVVGTVRAHTASIYQKLDVGNRTAAVARGRELSLV
jgi:LuxR family maltose regulon positive regulatory protein